MAQQNEHGRLIAAAAKAALAPIGCKRIGQSRRWISDERVWAIHVEFQPSAWSKGSFLNVRPIWLWLRMGARDFHPRPDDFIPFESAEQFTPLIEDMAAVAAQAVLDFRARFRTLADVNRYFAERITTNGWPVYRAAVTAGLVGDIETARYLFRRMESFVTENYPSWIALKAESVALAALLDDPARYRMAIMDAIAEVRQQLSLPPDPRCFESMDSIAGS